MDIISFSEGLQKQISEKLTEFNVEQDELLKVGSLLTFIRQTIHELKEYTVVYKFANQDEEIRFFKEVKPIFVSQFLYYKKVFQIRLFDSFREVKTRHANYYEILRKLERYVARNAEYYEYCLTNMTYMDSHYFTRSGTGHQRLNQDNKFSTGYDTKLGKILANELVKKFVLKLLESSGTDGHPNNNLTWTGSKTALIELVYALHASEVFNNGSVDLKLIASAFENSFNIKLGSYYRIFQDIRLRKSGQAMFLDELKSGLINKINNRT